MHLPEKTPVGIWIRVSTEMQVEADSPEHHEQRARAYAESRGWVVAKVYRLDAVSGKSVKDHPEAKRMLEDVEKGRIRALIFSKLARLARNTKELLDFSDHFQGQEAGLISLQEAIDTSTPAGRLFYTVIAAMAQWEREEISSRVAASVPIRAKLGKSLGGQAPFGYQWIDNNLIPHPEEAPVRRMIYELYAEHRRLLSVAKMLTQKGYRTRKGGEFSKTTVLRLLNDTTAKGMRIANRFTVASDGKTRILKPESEWVRVPVEPIVSEELWNECARIVAENAAPKKQAGRRPNHLFAGYVYCSCGAKMYVRDRASYYRCTKKGCRSRVPTKTLEEFYRGQLKDILHKREQVQEYLKEANDALTQRERLLAANQKELTKLTKETDTCISLYQAGRLDDESFDSRFQPAEERRKEIQKENNELEGEVDLLKVDTLNVDHILAETRDLYTKWGHCNKAEKRGIVELITQRIIIGQGEIDFQLFYFPQLGNLAKSDRDKDPTAWRKQGCPSVKSLTCATG